MKKRKKMPKFSIDYYERVNNYWHREIEADTLVEAQSKLREEIQGTEPDHIDIIGYEFEEGEQDESTD
jgi:hypothetical protein